MIFANLWRRKTRTFLTALGIAVGVAAVVALSAFGNGLADGFDRMFGTSSADLTVAQKDAAMLMISSLDEGLGDQLRAVPGVEQAVGVVFGVVQMTNAPYFVVMGEDPRGFSIQRYRLIAGGPITGPRQLLLGEIAARNFKKAVGETFRLQGGSYRVMGIYQTGVSLEDGGAVMPLDDAQRAFARRDQVSYFALKVRRADQIDALKAAIEERWPDLTATRSGEATRGSEFIGLYRSFGLFLGVFAALVGGLGMMNTTLMSVLERTREIGVLRALGWRRRRVMALILGEALVVAVLGGLLGLGLGVGLILLARSTPAVESLLPGALSPEILAQGFFIAVLLGLIGGVYPTWRAAQLAPSEAMRYEGGSGGGSGAPGERLLPAFIRGLIRRPARTAVTVAGLSLGVGFIVALIAMADGVLAEFDRLIGAGQSDLVAEQAGASDMEFSEIDERVAIRLRARPEVKSVSRVLFGFPAMGDVPFVMLFGLDPQEPYIQHYRLKAGRLPVRTGEIALGRFFARSLEKGVGDGLRLVGTTYRVVGLYENGSAYEDAGALVLIKDAQRILGKPRKASLLAIQLHDPNQAEALSAQLAADFPELLLAPAAGFTQRIQDFATLNAILGALMAVTVAVGGIVMTNAMLMSVFERTQEIGVLRALGWRRRRVVGLIVLEALVLSLVSAGVGAAIGYGLNQLLMLIPDFGAFFAPAYSADTFVKVLVLALVLGTLGGLYPAWRAAGLRPIEALRYE
jgi:ABC-type antimicrobial peptide transport system permease subunit